MKGKTIFDLQNEIRELEDLERENVQFDKDVRKKLLEATRIMRDMVNDTPNRYKLLHDEKIKSFLIRVLALFTRDK